MMNRIFKKTGAAAALAVLLSAPAYAAAKADLADRSWIAPLAQGQQAAMAAPQSTSYWTGMRTTFAALDAETADQIWTGPYAGLSFGYASGTSEHTYDRNGHGEAETNPDGVSFALSAGYNLQWRSGLVLGLETDLGVLSLEDDPKTIFDDHYYITDWGDWYAALRARAGYALGETLLFGTAGFALVDSDEVVIGNTPQEGVSNEGTMTAYVFGLGFERKLTEDFSLKAEWQHFSFMEESGTNIGPGGDEEDWTFDGSADLFRVGVNFAF